MARSLPDGSLDLHQFEPGNAIAETKGGDFEFWRRREKTVCLFRRLDVSPSQTQLHRHTCTRRSYASLLTINYYYRRVLISQDHLFLYITIAEWGLGYEEYLCGESRPPTPPSQGASPSGSRGRTGAKADTTPSAQNSGTESQNSRTSSPTQHQAQAQPPQNAEATQEELDARNFLTMSCYGPYEVTDRKHMAIFLRNALALMMELSDPIGP